MAQHGGTAYLVDAHSPTTPAPATLVGPGPQPAPPGPRPVTLSPSQAPSRRRPQPTSAPEGGVTLEAPRLDGERVANEYVETPFRAPSEHHHNHGHQHQQHHQQQQQLPPGGPRRAPPVHEGPRRVPGVARRTVAPEQPRPAPLGKHPPPPGTQPPVTKQPTSSPSLAAAAATATFTKDGPRTAGRTTASADCAAAASREGLAPGALGASIICPACGKCRCASCRSPRPLPSAWLCGNSCFCSAETSVDYASCLCCVKGLFYHCGGKEGYEGAAGATSCADDPCSCAPPRRCLRWACLCALSAALPCLLCYWPLRGVAGAVERCYGRYAGHGCRCQPRVEGGGSLGGPRERAAGGDLTPEKRLLAASPDF